MEGGPHCIICGKPFKKRAPKQITCSGDCSRERQRQHVRAYNQRMRTKLSVKDKYETATLIEKRKFTSAREAKYVVCPELSCRRTTEIAANKNSVPCWRCKTIITRSDGT